jgi:nitroimidazol reductase NimA-like FMN-containing flavoprotein (pyridoxamine 5'-phosphate oxidase superfamily)
MRKANREVKDRAELIDILNKCDVCRVAFFDEEYPYIVPMNFGVLFEENLKLYFHCAVEGKKLDLMKRNNRVSFEMDCSHQLLTAENACEYSMNYESLIGFGEIRVLTDREERIMGLTQIMKQYGRNENLNFDEEVLSRTVILELIAESFMGKRLKK